MTQHNCYVSLAIYSKLDVLGQIDETFRLKPTLTGNRKGIYSWIYSTKNAPRCASVEEHFKFLRFQFEAHASSLVELSKTTSELRLWVYFGMTDINQSFVISADVLQWASSIGADICLDLWASNADEIERTS